jgi:hypothetical protein
MYPIWVRQLLYCASLEVCDCERNELVVTKVVGSVQPTKTGTIRSVMLETMIKVRILMGLTTRPDADAIAQLRRGSVFDSVGVA